MCALRTKGGVLEHERVVQKFDGPQKKQKKNKTHFLESNTQTGTKECLSVTQSSRYRSIYIDWQRSYDE